MPDPTSPVGFVNGTLGAWNADYTGSSSIALNNGLITNGQLWIGATTANGNNTHINVGNIVSNGTLTIGYSSPNIVISLAGGGGTTFAVQHLTGTTGGALNPDGNNNFNLLAGTVASGTTPVAINGVGSTLTTNIQRSQAISAADATKVGLANFNSTQFTVDANGFVATSGTGVGNTITGQTGGALSPTAGNWNISGNGVSGSGTSTSGNIFTTGSGSTLTINNTQAQFATNYTLVDDDATPYTVLATDNYISCDVADASLTLKFPNAPTTNRIWTVKDLQGAASTNNILITTVGGSVTIDGQTTYTMASNYSALQLLFNGTSYEVY